MLGQNFLLNTTTLERSLQITVDRTAGLIGYVVATITIQHIDFVSTSHNIVFSDGQQISLITVPISNEYFLQYGTSYSVRLISVTSPNITDNAVPLLSSNQLQTFIKIPEIAANSIVQFSNNSIYVSAAKNSYQAVMTLQRNGLYGTITIPWSVGYPKVMVNKPSVIIGNINPSSGTTTMPHNQRIATVAVSCIIPNKISLAYHYVIHLNENLSPTQNEKGWPKLGVNQFSIIEPHGVVRISLESQKILVLEGQTADIVIERIFSTIGTIRVRYHTKLYLGSNPAIPDEDFIPMTAYVDFNDGEFKKTIQIKTIDDTQNPKPESKEIFYVQLSTVDVLTPRKHSKSPRLSANVLSEIIIQDNDDPYGIISIAKVSRNLNIDESSGFATIDIQRTGGAFSTSSVKVLTLGGGESWSSDYINNLDQNSLLYKAIQSRSNSASSGYDYDPFSTIVTFPESQNLQGASQIQQITVRILQDNLAEPNEQFIVVVTNSTGGASIFEPNSFSVVTINGNGLYNGEIGFIAKVANLDEDGDGFVELLVSRVGDRMQEVTVSHVFVCVFCMYLTKGFFYKK